MTDAQADHYILFTVADTAYAIPSREVAHVEMVEHVTAVPNAAPFVDGVVFSRGQVVPAVNMRARFGFPRTATDLRSRLLVVCPRGRTVGLLVDACREFLSIPAEHIRAAGESVSGRSTSYVSGIATIGERLIVILKVDDLLDGGAATASGVDMPIGEAHGHAQAQ